MNLRYSIFFRSLCYFFLIAIVLHSCKSIGETKRFSKCQFKVNRVVQFKAADINMLNKRKIGDLKFNEGVRLGKFVAGGKLPLVITVNVDVKNPNKQTAALEGFDYILALDGKDVLAGVYDTRTEIPALTAKSVNPTFSFDLLKVVRKTDYKTIMNIVFGLLNEKHEPVNITLMVKPHVRILGKKVKYPDYIRLTEVYQ